MTRKHKIENNSFEFIFFSADTFPVIKLHQKMSKISETPLRINN